MKALGDLLADFSGPMPQASSLAQKLAVPAFLVFGKTPERVDAGTGDGVVERRCSGVAAVEVRQLVAKSAAIAVPATLTLGLA